MKAKSINSYIKAIELTLEQRKRKTFMDYWHKDATNAPKKKILCLSKTIEFIIIYGAKVFVQIYLSFFCFYSRHFFISISDHMNRF